MNGQCTHIIHHGVQAALCIDVGNRLYGDEIERISGQRQRRTERLAVRAARRSRTLGLAYSLSMAASLLIFVTAAGNVAGS